jgi:predicted nucleotide-binding protein
LEEAESLLQSLIEEIEEYGEDEPSVQEENGKKVEVSGTDIFIVHGHDHRAKAELETFLKEIGLTPIVLHRKPDEGQTLIEKFERHSDVGYAFILLTPDETAYLTSEEAKPDADRIKEKRARPNVIFEFGYFIGKLGRSRVCCLHTGNVSIPSDLDGLLYKPFQVSIDEIAYSIIKELKAIGYKLKVD